MKIKTILIVMGMLLPVLSIRAQKLQLNPYLIGEQLTDIDLNSWINQPDSVTSFAAFGNKLIILDFWHTHCGSCIAKFPLEDSLQRKYPSKLQFVLVTMEAPDVVEAWLSKWNKTHKQPLSMPILTRVRSRQLAEAFPHRYNPFYVWLSPDGTILATSGHEMLSATIVTDMIRHISNRRSKDKFPGPSSLQKLYLHENNN